MHRATAGQRDTTGDAGGADETNPASYEGSAALEADEGGIDLPLASTITAADNMFWVTRALRAYRDRVLEDWLDAVSDQPFHAGRAERPIADHVPALYDALVVLLESVDRGDGLAGGPLDNQAVLQSAQAHASMRALQGLQPNDVVVEFRLLRRQINRVIADAVPDGSPTRDVVAALSLVNDAIDGAISVGLSALMRRIEEVREDFLVTTIHEVRQPLTNIKGVAQLARRILDRNPADHGQIADGLDRINEETDRMVALLSALVDASRAALGHLELNLTEAPVEHVIRQAVELLDPREHSRVQTAISNDGALTGVWDADRLTQVLTNILSNAVKYSPPGTPITVSAAARGDEVEIAVRDEGDGIDPSDLPRLFQRYARAGSALERGVEGLGLGLYLCRQIVEAHGGRIWAESQGRGHGTTMHIVLPRQVRQTLPRV